MNEHPQQPPDDDVAETRYLPEMKDDDADSADAEGETARIASSKSTKAPAANDFADEQMIGEFKLIRRLGKGGMAEVWLAEQTSLKRPVALKLLRGELIEDESYIKRFQREATSAAGLNHANIVAVYAVGEEKGQHFIAQEYIQGQTLRQVITKKGALDLPLALHIMRQVAAALEAAGERGIIHRDIKPDNIMVNKKGEVKVADFGLAQLVHGGGEALHLTQPGETMGTPLYMSPEQVRGDKLDQRSDIYSLGVTCYHMLAGRPPFQGETAVSVAMQHLQSEPAALTGIREDLPKPACEMVHRMMAKDPQERYANAADVLTDVKNLLRAVKAGEADQFRLSKLTGPQVDRSFEVRHPAIALSILCVLIALASAGLGWAMRPGDPLQTPVSEEQLIKPAGSAREQYLQAMLSGNEEEFLAVKEHWGNEREWVNRAEEQLLLIYLSDPSRHDEARDQAMKVGSLANQDERFRWKARIADAWLAAHGTDADKSRARELLSSVSQFENQMNDTWRNLMGDAARIAARNPTPQPNGPPPSTEGNSPEEPPEGTEATSSGFGRRDQRSSARAS